MIEEKWKPAILNALAAITSSQINEELRSTTCLRRFPQTRFSSVAIDGKIAENRIANNNCSYLSHFASLAQSYRKAVDRGNLAQACLSLWQACRIVASSHGALLASLLQACCELANVEHWPIATSYLFSNRNPVAIACHGALAANALFL